jgi:alpha-L-rhamnosidase
MVKHALHPVLYPLLVSAALLVSGCKPVSTLEPAQLLCETKTNPAGIATACPRFSWKNLTIDNKVEQTAYQILVASSPALLNEKKADLWNSEKVPGGTSTWIPYEGIPLESRSVVWWKIRIWDQDNVPSGWSEMAHFSVGLLENNEWKGQYIGLESVDASCTSPLLRKSFSLEKDFEQLYLHVNSLGYHEIWVNNHKVGDAEFAPAESQFDKRSFSLSYDLSPYLIHGKNAVVLWLGYGWYEKAPDKVHNGPLVKAQLEGLKEDQWNTLLVTDGTWIATGSGYSQLPPEHSGFGGEVLDATQLVDQFSDPDLDDSEWKGATQFQVPEHLVTPQVVEMNKVHDTLQAVSVYREADGSCMVDMGRNFTGKVHIRYPKLPKGHMVTMRYTDHLKKEVNSLYKKQIDQYISDGSEGTFCNKFNYQAFRYIKIENLPVEIHPKDVTGYLIHTGFREAATFSCSDETLNRLHDLFAYTLKCLTLGGKIVDCPHHERLGYGGDGNACTMTAQTLYDLSPLYTTWLTHWADSQLPDGSMPHTAPSYWGSGGGPYWCTFIIKAAWETYINYGDIRLLERFYPSMLKWLEFVESYSPDMLLQPWPENYHRKWYLGDWATPEGIDQEDPRSVHLVSNCAIVDSYDKMVKMARLLGKETDAERFESKQNDLGETIHTSFYHPETATYGSGVQVDLAYPLLMGIVPDSLQENVVGSLITETMDNRKGHFATGLVGLPILTQWAIREEASEMMYQMLTKKEYPGFGYMLENGATTTWEHWEGHRSRIHNCYHGAGSWLYQSLAGIQPLEGYPAYERFILAPRPPDAVTWAQMTKQTPYGIIQVDWNIEGDQMTMEVTVPVGSTADLRLPNGTEQCMIDDKVVKPDQKRHIWIENGTYRISYTL